MKIITIKNYDEMSKLAADLIAAQIKESPKSVLGFATGSTPVGTYKNLIELYNLGQVDFSQITTFNLDEYCGLERTNTQSYYYFMQKMLFAHVGISPKQIHFPDSVSSSPDTACADYEKQIEAAGGIDLQLLGVGFNGHIGFNEPDKVFHNTTHKVTLAENTIANNARFFENREEVPTTAITMGIGTIMSARKIVLLAGADKAEIIKKLTAPTTSPDFPVSVLKYHPDCTIIFAKD